MIEEFKESIRREILKMIKTHQDIIDEARKKENWRTSRGRHRHKVRVTTLQQLLDKLEKEKLL